MVRYEVSGFGKRQNRQRGTVAARLGMKPNPVILHPTPCPHEKLFAANPN
jgi:hypothetical protein